MIDRLPQIDGAAVRDIDPRTVFGSPEEIQNAEGLSQVQKQELLSRWAELSRQDGQVDMAEHAAQDNEMLNDEAGKD